MAILVYIAKLITISALLYSYYHLFLRNKRFHHYNRFYLLAITLVSFVIPFITIPVNPFWVGEHPTGLIKTLKVINATGWEEPVTIYAYRNGWTRWLNAQTGLYLVYLAGLLTGLVILMRSLFYIHRLKKKYPFEIVNQLKIFNTDEPGTPFSFFRSIFWDKKIAFNNPEGQQIFRHELFHVKEKHSADVMLLEIITCIGWFNPFFHVIKKEIKAIHEFLADDYAASGNNRYDYAELLVLHAIQQKAPAITHPFFHNQIKRRITMITQSNLVRRSGYISRIMALPLLFLLVSAFAVKLTHQSLASSITQPAGKKMTVVIDAGHGGIFNGATTQSNVYEKNIALDIAQKIQQLSASYNVNVILTRNSDQLVGNATNFHEDLENRTAIANDIKSDLLVSIHVNAWIRESLSYSGFDAYISAKKDAGKSTVLASAILNNLKSVYTTNDIVKQRKVGIQVLDKTNCPSVIIECGYLTNPKDVAFITDAGNQEKVARKILEGIVQYGNAAANFSGTSSAETVPTVTFYNKTAEPSGDRMDSVHFTKSDTVPENKIFTKVEFEAECPGGAAAWKDFLFKTIDYPKAAQDKEIKGTVVVQFIVDENGKVSDVKTISGPKELLAESIRVIKASGNWTSAMQNGKKVKSYKRQPIIYKLERATVN